MIVIEPTNPQIVYVPQYNTEVVHTQAPTTTVIIKEADDDAEEAPPLRQGCRTAEN